MRGKLQRNVVISYNVNNAETKNNSSRKNVRDMQEEYAAGELDALALQDKEVLFFGV